MPVGRRRSVCTSHSCSSRRRTVSPAPPSNKTLSGTTTAARPSMSSSVLTCWTKFSCLFVDRAVCLVDDDDVVGLDRDVGVVDDLDRPGRLDPERGALVDLLLD